MTERVPKDEAISDIVVSILLCLITCGIYNLFWNAKQMKVVNGLLGREEFSFIKWLLLSFITCGIFHIYYEYLMGEAVLEIQRKDNRPEAQNLVPVSIILSILGFSIVVDAIQQHEINKLYEAPR
jgi:hypothetical protein